MRNLFLLFIIPVFIYSCSVSKESSVKASDFPGESSDSLVAYIERTRCFGVCPTYSIRIYRSGYVIYEGYDHVTNIGRYYKWITAEQLTSIGLKAEELGYFNLNDEYRNPHLTDFPTIFTEVRFRGKKKKITHYDADPPASLVEMEKYIDGVFPPGTTWIKHPVQEIKE